VPKADWQKPQPFSTKHAGPITGGKVVDLDAEKAKHELEEKVAALEKERDQWKEKAARTEPAQWRDNPDDLAAVWAKLDANAAIDFYEALEQKLKGTPEWWAYLDERLEEHLNAARRIREQYAAEDEAALNADPKERGIARIKNALELALRADTSEQEAIAAFAGARRLCEEAILISSPGSPTSAATQHRQSGGSPDGHQPDRSDQPPLWPAEGAELGGLRRARGEMAVRLHLWRHGRALRQEIVRPQWAYGGGREDHDALL